MVCAPLDCKGCIAIPVITEDLARKQTDSALPLSSVTSSDSSHALSIVAYGSNSASDMGAVFTFFDRSADVVGVDMSGLQAIGCKVFM